MNTAILKGKWDQAKGKVKKWVGELTGDEAERIDGSFDELIGKIEECDAHVREMEEKDAHTKGMRRVY